MDIVKMKIAELHPAKYNPRLNLKPGDAEWEHIQNSINTFGYIDPIIVNKRNNIIVGGHQRYKILKSMGYDEIDCVLVDMDEQQERACNAALNKAQGGWDYDMLDELLDNITAFDMSDFGFEIDSINVSELDKEDDKTGGVQVSIAFASHVDYDLIADDLKSLAETNNGVIAVKMV